MKETVHVNKYSTLYNKVNLRNVFFHDYVHYPVIIILYFQMYVRHMDLPQKDWKIDIKIQCFVVKIYAILRCYCIAF